ncbi:glycosyltransferase family 25 protein [Pararhodobacter sp. SW119]|uniref:glycosyltransferase family 25 protein n=1 Tax=Pararhodobacter sp. SW119 TaxID=2780075 RepID=UPI001AE07B0D|nr:glycosyltransferase family 25 protein [Pararhodobacter sp. SW119]
MPKAADASGLALSDALGPLYVISLAHRLDRRREFAAQLAKIGLSLKDSRVRVFPGVRPEKADGFPSVGAHGCFMSHLGVLRAALAEDAAGVIVCEDDLDFGSDLSARVPQMLQSLAAEDWDILYAGHLNLPKQLEPSLPGGLSQLKPALPVHGAHFLVFRCSVIAPLIASLEAILARPRGHPDGGPMHVDGAFNHFRANNPQVIALAALPALGFQRSSRTDIHALRWFDRLPVIRDAVSLARRVTRRRI